MKVDECLERKRKPPEMGNLNERPQDVPVYAHGGRTRTNRTDARRPESGGSPSLRCSVRSEATNRQPGFYSGMLLVSSRWKSAGHLSSRRWTATSDIRAEDCVARGPCRWGS